MMGEHIHLYQSPVTVFHCTTPVTQLSELSHRSNSCFFTLNFVYFFYAPILQFLICLYFMYSTLLCTCVFSRKILYAPTNCQGYRSMTLPFLDRHKVLATNTGRRNAYIYVHFIRK